MSVVDQYINEVIKRGDQGSELLAARCAPTLKNSPYVEILREGMNGISVLRIPDDYYVVVHSTAGDPNEYDISGHAASLIDRLFVQAENIGATPLGIADVIDARTGDIETIEKIVHSLIKKANGYGIAIMNGELAILGDRVIYDANISGTMISMVQKKDLNPCVIDEKGTKYAVFDHLNKAIFINSDGVGTKTEFYERAKKYRRALRDSLEMKLSDVVKYGAKPQAIFDVVEMNGDIDIGLLDDDAHYLSKLMGATYLLEYEDVGNRLKGWSEGAPVF
ncbi:MAG: AIR synthase related protein, partial [Candidatus Aenigmarchaeota archaeon]|nr:AIR synthase related protein [Candidatus Aenigmarchaeota archaeon]MDI6722145.1 AIR synthase related protein [Candidatus Aenigmarchaeota archaeon]